MPPGKAFLDAISVVCAHGHGLELFHVRYLCGSTFRAGAPRAEAIRRATLLQAPWLAEARAARREVFERQGGTTQLMRAAHRPHQEHLVRELVAAGAPLDLVSNAGWSALHYACYRGRTRIVRLLLEGKFDGRGASVDLQNDGGFTALMLAATRGDESIVSLLLAHNADTELQTRRGFTALHFASAFPNILRELKDATRRAEWGARARA